MRSIQFDHMSAGGVSYSANPLTGDSTEVIIYANYGHNSTVTSGVVDPDAFVVDKTTFEIKSKHLGQKQYIHLTAPDLPPPEATIVKGLERCVLAERNRKEYSMSDTEIREVTGVTIRVEESLGFAADVEWMFGHKGKLYVLQARPITAQLDSHSSHDIALLATGGESLFQYMSEDALCYNSPENRCYFISFVAYIVSNCNESLAQQCHHTALRKWKSTDYRLQDLRTIPQAAKEIPSKDYAPGQLLEDVSQVLRALGRIVKALSKGKAQLAYDIAKRITWVRTRRVIFAGIYGACLTGGGEKLATEILNSLRKEEEITLPSLQKKIQATKRLLKGEAVSSVRTAQGQAVIFDMDEDGTIVNASKGYEGCIGVVPWASPNIAIIISVCAGIICEHGSLLCHAATTIREAKKCGIVNVNEATQVIKDGYFVSIHDDTVEVFAK